MADIQIKIEKFDEAFRSTVTSGPGSVITSPIFKTEEEAQKWADKVKRLQQNEA